MRLKYFSGAIIAIMTCYLYSSAAQSSQQTYVQAISAESSAKPSGAVTINDDGGGYVIDYMLRVFELRDARKEVRFAGRCDSACTLYLALPNSQTCIEPGAYFRFHAPAAPSKADVQTIQSFMMLKYPKWVRSWIRDQGGLSERLVTMDYAFASKFVRLCV